MKRWIQILVGLLAVQVVFFLGLTYRDFGSTGAKKAESLLTLDFDKTDKVVAEESGKKVEFTKKEGKWVIPTLFNFPVSAEKVTQVLKKLVEMKRTYPVGNTKMAAKTFETTDEKFERKLTFFTGDKVQATLYLGGSPTFHKVYARADQDDKTYSIEFNSFDVPTTAKEWADHDIYKFDRSKVAQIKFKDFSLTRDGASFVLGGLNADEVTNPTETDAFLSKLTNPYFEDVLSTGTYETGAKTLDYTIVNEDKTERQFTYFEMKPDPNAPTPPQDEKGKSVNKEGTEFAVLKVSDMPYYFKLRKARVDELLKTQRSAFLKKKADAEKKKSDLKEAGQTGVPTKG